jgi:protein-export membrane protein SecD
LFHQKKILNNLSEKNMYKLSLQRIIMILAVCVLGIFFTVPNFVKDAKNTLPSWWQPVNLGLDLQGGSSLLLEVDLDAALKDRMQNLEDSARSALKEVRIRYQGINSGADGLKVKIADAGARAKAITPLRKMDEGLVVTDNGENVLIVTYDEPALNEIRRKLVDQSIEIVRKRIDEYGTNEPIIQAQGYGRILVQLPGVQNPEEIKVLLGKTAKMTFHLVDSSTTAVEAKRGKLKSSSRLIRGSAGEQYVIVRKPAVDGSTLTDASVSFQDGSAAVSFKFNNLGAKKFGDVTKNNVGEQLAIVLDDEVISAPTIQSAITGGSGVITGNYTSESAQELALLLRSGALPAPLNILEERTVGAGLGADSIEAGIFASIIGFIGVLVFLLLAYGLFGLFTSITVFLNLFLMLGALSILGATLTLPGIAGIILTIGMAVDANVLIFERMREEVKSGRSIKDALETGFNFAWGTIIDSNLTTLIAAAVLFYFGSGPVRGFAVTLAVGILTSLFTSVTVTRLIITAWFNRYKPKALPI